MKEIIGTGKTVEIAVDNVLKELGMTREQVTVEILELPKKKFFKTIPAKVKITTVQEKEQPVKPVTVKETPVATQKTTTQTQEPAQISEKAKKAVEFLTSVSKDMGVTGVTITPTKQGEVTILKIEGKNIGTLIGRRGETMEALSYLTGLVVNKGTGDYEKISLDVAGYRSKREKDLEELATRIGKKVAQTGRSHSLEPMNPYERRIIHSIISDMENVKSESTGEGADRRIVIRCTGANAKPNGETAYSSKPSAYAKPRTTKKPAPAVPTKPVVFRPNTNVKPGSKPAPKTSGSYNNAKRFDKPKAEPIVSTRTETFDDAVDIGLYGKIEL